MTKKKKNSNLHECPENSITGNHFFKFFRITAQGDIYECESCGVFVNEKDLIKYKHV